MTRGSQGQVTNLRFTTVLSVRSARSDERVVKSKGALPAPGEKKIDFNSFFLIENRDFNRDFNRE